MQLKPTIRKVPADSVPFGEDICQRGNSVWAAYDGERLVCVAPTAKEARLRYQRIAMKGAYGNPPTPMPDYLDGRRDRAHKLAPNEPIGVGGQKS